MPKAKDRASLFATITDGLTDVAQEDILRVPLSRLIPNPNQPRRYFEPEALKALADSISKRGVLEPLLVRPKGDALEIVAGERRYRASQIAAQELVPVIVKELKDQEAIEIALVENLQREDLNPVEETEALISLYALRYDIPRTNVATELQQRYFAVTRGEDVEELEEIERFFTELASMNWKSFVNHRLPILRLPKDVLLVLEQGKLEYTKAREVARVKDSSKRENLLQLCIDEAFSLNEIKERVRTFTNRTAHTSPPILVRMDKLRSLAKKSQALKKPASRKKVEALLVKLETLLENTDE